MNEKDVPSDSDSCATLSTHRRLESPLVSRRNIDMHYSVSQRFELKETPAIHPCWGEVGKARQDRDIVKSAKMEHERSSHLRDLGDCASGKRQ